MSHRFLLFIGFIGAELLRAAMIPCLSQFRDECVVGPVFRLTSAFSKKLQNLKAAVALHVCYYNWCWRPRENGKSGRYRPTPAMMAGVVDTLWKMEDLYDRVLV